MVHYIYRNLYKNPDGPWPLIYIGSWHHEFPGSLDKNYHGSSVIAKKKHLKLLKEEILIDGIPSDYASVVEAAVIAQEGHKYGWLNEGGRVINQHCMYSLRGPRRISYKEDHTMLVELWHKGKLVTRGSLFKVCVVSLSKPKWVDHVYDALCKNSYVVHGDYKFVLIREGKKYLYDY